MAEDDRREELERLRQVIAEKWPESTRKQQVLSVLDEMVMEADPDQRARRHAFM
jgi:hypothetical protein